MGYSDRKKQQDKKQDNFGATGTVQVSLCTRHRSNESDICNDDVFDVMAVYRWINGSGLTSYEWGYGACDTAGARTHLYRYLDGLQEKAICCDTESVFYIQKVSEKRVIECEGNLGGMTNELKPGEYIEDFVSGVPSAMPIKWLIPLQIKRKPSVSSRDNIKIYRAVTGEFWCH